MVTGKGETIKGLYLVAQESAESVHEDTEKVPAPLLVHTTFPVGDLPTTLAVHVEAEPKVTDEGMHVTDVPGVEA
jgi:hypothetical protein